MRVSVLLFASYAEAFGTSELEFTLPGDATVGDLLLELGRMQASQGLPPAGVAVNCEYAPRSRRLRPGDEVAVIPPVAGG